MAGATAALAFAFMQLGSEVAEGDTRGFDMWLLRLAQALREHHPGMVDIMRDLSGLGSTVAMTLLTAATTGYLLLSGNRRMAALVATAVASGAILVSLFKTAYGRERPALAYADFIASGLSYPSGHASMSAIVFMTLGGLVASTRTRAAERLYILGAAMLMTALVGLSRVALGVHWATDVLGGWAFGLAWALAWIWMALRLR